MNEYLIIALDANADDPVGFREVDKICEDSPEEAILDYLQQLERLYFYRIFKGGCVAHQATENQEDWHDLRIKAIKIA